MPNVGSYDVVRDEKIVLGDFSFPLEFDPSVNVAIRSVLSYMVHPGSSGMTFKMSIDSPDPIEIVPATALPPQISHARQEVIPVNVFKKTGSKLRIKVTAGSGSFSGVVLHYMCSI